MAGNGKSVRLGEGEYRWLEKGLRGMGFFAKLSLKELAGVLPYIHLEDHPKGRVLCKEGGKGDSFFLIYKGGVEVSKKNWDKPVAKLKEGQFFGEMSLLFGHPRNATVKTLKPTQLFELKANDFSRILKKNPGVAKTVRKVADERRRALAQI
ncbi:MAG: cyclic nucleotide-binding domain-containing protein [Elusimicrobiota bacterium]